MLKCFSFWWRILWYKCDLLIRSAVGGRAGSMEQKSYFFEKKMKSRVLRTLPCAMHKVLQIDDGLCQEFGQREWTTCVWAMRLVALFCKWAKTFFSIMMRFGDF